MPRTYLEALDDLRQRAERVERAEAVVVAARKWREAYRNISWAPSKYIECGDALIAAVDAFDAPKGASDA